MFALNPARNPRSTEIAVTLSDLRLPESASSHFPVGTRSRKTYLPPIPSGESICAFTLCASVQVGSAPMELPIIETNLIAGRRYQMQRPRATHCRTPATPVECALTQKRGRGWAPAKAKAKQIPWAKAVLGMTASRGAHARGLGSQAGETGV